MREKAAYYIANGSRMVWLLYPEKRLIEIFQPAADIQILTEADTLNGGDVLPGFMLPVRDAFAVSLSHLLEHGLPYSAFLHRHDGTSAKLRDIQRSVDSVEVWI